MSKYEITDGMYTLSVGVLERAPDKPDMVEIELRTDEENIFWRLSKEDFEVFQTNLNHVSNQLRSRMWREGAIGLAPAVGLGGALQVDSQKVKCP